MEGRRLDREGAEMEGERNSMQLEGTEERGVREMQC